MMLAGLLQVEVPPVGGVTVSEKIESAVSVISSKTLLKASSI